MLALNVGSDLFSLENGVLYINRGAARPFDDGELFKLVNFESIVLQKIDGHYYCGNTSFNKFSVKLPIGNKCSEGNVLHEKSLTCIPCDVASGQYSVDQNKAIAECKPKVTDISILKIGDPSLDSSCDAYEFGPYEGQTIVAYSERVEYYCGNEKRDFGTFKQSAHCAPLNKGNTLGEIETIKYDPPAISCGDQVCEGSIVKCNGDICNTDLNNFKCF